MAYITKADIEGFLNITLLAQGENLVNSIIPAIEKAVDNYTGRNWSIDDDTDIVEVFDGGHGDTFFLNNPIASIESIEVDGGPVATEDIYDYGHYVRLGFHPSEGFRNVEITYRTSANAVPADIKHAIVQWVSQIFKSQDGAGKTVQSVSAGTVSISYATRDGMPGFVKEILDRYRIIRV